MERPRGAARLCQPGMLSGSGRFLGASIGRYANRIANSRYTLTVKP